MNIKYCHKLVGFCILFIAFIPCKAQQHFLYKATLGDIPHTGFYKITLVPGLISKSNIGLSDLRIAGDSGKLVPYVLKSDLPVFSRQEFLEFPILSRTKTKDSTSEIVITNTFSQPISALLLMIRNSSVYRTASFSGSDDGKQWFAVTENIVLEEANSDTSEHDLQSISFPRSNYKFFKIIINDKGLLPLNILKAGIFAHSTNYGKYLQLPDPVIRQKDSSDKNSYVDVFFKERYQVDRLHIITKSAARYRRILTISDNSGTYRRQLEQMEIIPGRDIIELPSVNTNHLLITIANKDDAALTLSQVQAAQLSRYLVTYLQAGKKYAIVTGDSTAVAPEYDLKYFADTLSGPLQEIIAGPIERNPVPVASPVIVHPANSNSWLWFVLIGILLLLISLSFKMIKAISKKEDHDRL